MITEQQTVSEIAADSLAAVRVFEKHGINFCCQGSRQLGEVCRERQLAPEEIIDEIDAALQVRSTAPADWRQASTPDLIQHILSAHHQYLKSELPRLQVWVDKAKAKYDIGRLPAIFEELRSELETHLQKEELVLFPAILGNLPIRLGGPIRVMLMEHDHAHQGLEAIRSETGNFQAPAYACRTYRALYEGLQDLDADLRQHIYLENEILFPRVLNQ
jgi:regulator of cell morphogenesis and NO signaling